MILQSISGIQADPLFAEFGDANKGIRQGMPMGAVVELTGTFSRVSHPKRSQDVLLSRQNDTMRVTEN